MKKLFAVLLTAALVLTLGACTKNGTDASSTDAETATEPVPETLACITADEEIVPLVAYFSGGNEGVPAVAGEIAKVTGGTEFEIKTSENYEEATGLMQQEINEDTHPAITDRVEDMSSYNAVFIGFPAVDGQMPMAVVSFMEEYDLRDKLIIPFVYTDGEDCSGVTRKIDSVTFGSSQVLMLKFNADTSGNDITAWLTGLGF